uniref:NADH dehydrogenase subunit 3 n=1 Tax=Megaxyela euchroma TaxID=1874363 RepID=UPI0021FAA04F|nr:NADH dehydrogenase subunit 3 [Megaxyela euchroma]UXP85889.1 NADH dehydrogenase subunit 3 [Megaxyela euchroma]
MILLLAMSTIIFMLCLIVMSLASILSKKSMTDREKCSPFECGFDPKSSARLPFSLRFFLIAVIFLIFDVEIALLLPMVIVMPLSNMKNWICVSILFILILLLGLYHEWNEGSLNWTM